jgi:nucleolar complex protein 3
MGRRNKKLAKLQQAQQAREFLRHKETPPSFKHLSSEEKRIEIAYTSTIILSNPELQYTKLESIFELCDDPDPSIQALAASSLCSIFIDILPGYKIKSHEEEKIALSKETKALRIYESDLLKFYSRYIDGLEYLNSFGAINLMCRLLSKLSHFNLRERILAYLLKHLNEGLDEVIDVIAQILKSADLEFKYTTVKAIEQFVKSTSFKIIPERIIEVLSSLKFSKLQNEDGFKKRKREEDYESKRAEDEVLNVIST